MRKYKLVGGFNGYPLYFLSGADELQKKPDPKLIKYINLPVDTTKDILTFGAKFVESRANLNRAWFDNDELINAYGTIPFKAIDIEHELDKIVGHIHTHAYVDRTADKLISPEEFASLSDQERSDATIDVLVGGVAYIDRFPNLEGPLSTKAFKVSMECWFEAFDILLENGVRLTMDEALGLGLGDFIDQLMGPHKSAEEFQQAHTLNVLLADNKQHKMGVYKYLKNILFSGAGLVINPACPSCHILTTDRDEDCGCKEMKQAASVSMDDKDLFTLDLREFKPYMEDKKGRTKAMKTVDDIIKEVADEAPMGGPVRIPKKRLNELSPSMCPNYKSNVQNKGDDVPTTENEGKRHWCTYADLQCAVAGDRTDTDCHRWIKYLTSDGEVVTTDEFDLHDVQDQDMKLENQKAQLDEVIKQYTSMNSIIELARLNLEAHELDCQLREQEEAAPYKTKTKNDLPDSCFAVVESCADTNKAARHLPYKNADGSINLAHLRNALARMNQITSECGGSDEAIRAKARSKLIPLAKKHFPDSTFNDKKGD